MKKKHISKIASAVLLSQMLLTTPLQVLADEQLSIPASQSSTMNNQSEESTSSSDEQTGTSTTHTTTDSTESSTDQSTPEDTTSTTESAEKPTEDSTTNSTSTTESSSESKTDETKPSETKPSESKPEKPNTGSSTNESQTQSTTEPSNNQVKAPNEEQQAKPAESESKPYHQTPTAPIQELVPSSKETAEGNIHFEKDESVESFVRKIGESARKVGQENDLYASVMIAQAILESASGQSQLAQAPNYNLFGIKGTHNGKGVSFATQEDLGDGTLYTTQATFRQYENYEDSLNDYAQLLKEGLTGNSQFYSGVWKTNAKTYQEATKFLTGRYATDTNYNQKLNGLIETYDLTSYDKEVAGPQLSKEGYIVPVKYYTISSPFGNRGGEFHRGLDLAAAQGEPIYASKSGTVVKAEFHPSWGNYVAIEHEDGTTALYAHQQEYQVKVGAKVKQGQIIGYVGSTGNSTGSHLHFELCRDNTLVQSQLVDPETVLF
ncbi:glucosaminidase domain-containing protein [Enterococcus faecium]|uniref:glucosaminidase domain-containing protein n=1 Tax=Enterococcus faecium TaxID=1352 RepID=UPI000BF08C9F|nr:glucosaminidase domain-containing protein [Enterococcus faecium]PEH49708.1 N-acetylmuramoyl-L-alanine amidase [Enterococcus faecium]